jgi:hypothetical protein
MVTAPLASLNFSDLDISTLQRFPDLGWQSMDEFGSEFDRRPRSGVATSKNSAADSAARFDHQHGMARTTYLGGSGQARDTGSHNNDVQGLRW